MKFVKEISPKGFLIPRAAMILAGFEPGRQAEYHIRDNLAVVLNRQMTAMELLDTAQALQELAVDLYKHLADACGPCEIVATSSASLVSGLCPKTHSLRCGSSSGQTRAAGLCPDTYMGGCPFAEEDSTVELPGWLRRDAGIPEEAKLCVEVDAEKGVVIVSEADYRHDLRDLPADVVEMFSDAGACLEELEKHLIAEDVVYGG